MKVIYSQEKIQNKIHEIGLKINTDYKKLVSQEEPLIILCVLRGGFIFCADLVRTLNLPIKIDFITLSSYENQTHSTGKVKIKCNLRENINNKHILIVEDIIDSGLTMDFLKKELSQSNPKSIRLATFLTKPTKTIIKHEIDYYCFEVPDLFVVGYGLDYEGLYRELPDLNSI